jgi:hypothetical protein
MNPTRFWTPFSGPSTPRRNRDSRSTSRSPGENEPDQVDAAISAYAEPFYIRA